VAPKPRSPLAAWIAGLARRNFTTAADAHLLRRFAEDRDGPAFAELVGRYGPLVWRVARAALGPGPAAEDVFQITFLALARNAAAVRRPDALAGWLHCTARRAAARVRRAESRRVPLSDDVPQSESPLDNLTARELLAAVDEEIQALPDALRAPLLLCGVEGLSQEEAAARLGWSAGSVKGRLERARARLRRRLAARGLAAPAALAGLAGMVGEASAVPPALVVNVLSAARGGPVSAAVARGAAEVAMSGSAWWKSLLVVLLAGGLALAAGAGLVGQRPDEAPRPAPAAPPDRPTPPAKAPAEGRLLVFRDTKFLFLTPDGKETGELPGHGPGRLILNEPVLSPDGKRVAFTVNEDPPTDDQGNVRRHVLVRDAGGKDPDVEVAVNALNVAWTPDGKGLVAPELMPAKLVIDRGFVAWLVDVRTKEKTRLDLPRWAHVFAMMPDGKSFVAALYDLGTLKIHLALVGRDGKEVTRLTELRAEGSNPRPSPDGSRILFQDYDPADKPEKGMPRLPRLFVYDLRAKKRERLAEIPLNATVLSYCWSPDSKRVAYTWKQVQPGVPLAENTGNMNDPKLNTETESHLIVADADGRNAKTVLSAKSERATTITLRGVDWQ
jgi:RNA polymerase sigma factor (sigma-70 family)